jgi:hypothetical protein
MTRLTIECRFSHFDSQRSEERLVKSDQPIAGDDLARLTSHNYLEIFMTTPPHRALVRLTYYPNPPRDELRT